MSVQVKDMYENYLREEYRLRLMLAALDYIVAEARTYSSNSSVVRVFGSYDANSKPFWDGVQGVDRAIRAGLDDVRLGLLTAEAAQNPKVWNAHVRIAHEMLEEGTKNLVQTTEGINSIHMAIMHHVSPRFVSSGHFVKDEESLRKDINKKLKKMKGKKR